jgi:hypothetical protein
MKRKPICLLASLFLVSVSLSAQIIPLYGEATPQTVTIEDERIAFDLVMLPYDFGEEVRHRLLVSVSLDEDHGSEIELGTAIDDIPYFATGRTVMLSDDNAFFLAPLAHIALRYDPESTSRQELQFLRQHDDQHIVARWVVAGITDGRTRVPFLESEVEAVTVAFLYDYNLNGVVDEFELERIRLLLP